MGGGLRFVHLGHSCRRRTRTGYFITIRQANLESDHEVVQAIFALAVSADIMVLPGHLAGGYLVTKALLVILHPVFSVWQMRAIYVVGIIASELPDVDIGVLFVDHLFSRKCDKASHREYITHAPFFWLLISLTIVLVGYIFSDIFVQFVGWALLAGTFTHFILDSLEYGIAWLRPFSARRFFLREIAEEKSSKTQGSLGYYWELICNYYIHNWTFYLEIAITVVAICIFIFGH